VYWPTIAQILAFKLRYTIPGAISHITVYTFNHFLQSPQTFKKALLYTLNYAFKDKSTACVIYPFKTSSKKTDSRVTTDEFGLRLRSEMYSSIPGKTNDSGSNMWLEFSRD
jgi:hypothetical protein